MVVCDELRDGMLQVSLTQRHDAVETLNNASRS
jgi:hypothetical protein